MKRQEGSCSKPPCAFPHKGVHELWCRSFLPGAGEGEVPQDAAAENGGVSTPAAAGGAAAVGADDEASLCGALFRGLVFFLGREVPREALLLVIRCADETPELLVQKCRSTACECWLLYALYRRHEIADDITLTWSAEGLTTQTRSAFSLQDTYCLSRGLAWHVSLCLANGVVLLRLRGSLLLCRSFGGTVGWDGEGSPILESDESITHQACPRHQSLRLTLQQVTPEDDINSSY